MNHRQRKKLNQIQKQQRASSIIDGSQDQFRQDGYTNMLNKYGSTQDNSTAYEYDLESVTDDMELTSLYEGNGLFAKIIDRPAEEAVKHGFDIQYGDQDIAEYVEERMDRLEMEDRFATAEKWARLYGGAIIVMLVDDGRGLEEPLDWKNVRSIEELRVFERSLVQPDYLSMNQFHFEDSMRSGHGFGEPEYYHVFSTYGYFTVHRSRCLVFRNGRLPERTSNAIYRYWGIPEYVRMKRELRECITAHGNGGRLLERCVQAIYKMKNLANMLSTDAGENQVLKRLQVIDMARNLLNSIAIDNDGEEYSFESFAMSGVKDILDATCNMLSAVTNIPQTILFGRSPAGMNATGENDLENYYNMVENIQKQNMKANSRTVIDLILRQGKLEGKIAEVPKYKVRFASLWSMSEKEQAAVEKTKADTKHTKAQTAQIYMDSSVLDPSEVRKSLVMEGDFDIEEVISPDDLELPDDAFDLGIDSPIHITDFSDGEEKAGSGENAMVNISGADAEKMIQISGIQTDGAEPLAAAVLVIHDGRILCASRRGGEGICGPGGKMEVGETPEEAAVREAQEEFHITPLNLISLGDYKGSPKRYLPCRMYFTDQFIGKPEANGNEMISARWLTLQELSRMQLFPPFEKSIHMLGKLLEKKEEKIPVMAMDGGPGSGNFGHGGRPGQVGGSGKGGTRKIGEINPDDMDAAIQYFGDQIRNREVENTVVIDREGNVYHAVGNVDGVGIDGVDLNGAVITHNHPEANGILSFGEDDFYFLREHQDIKELQCANKEYTYQISILKDISEVVYNDIYREGFKYRYDPDYEAQDAAMRVLQERGYVKYDKRRVES